MRSFKKRAAQGQSTYAPKGRSSGKAGLSAAVEATAPVERARVWMAERLGGGVLPRAGTITQTGTMTRISPLVAATTGVVVHPAIANGIWDGGGDGISWSNPLNWSNDVLPSANDDVMINAANVTVVHDTGTDSVHRL